MQHPGFHRTPCTLNPSYCRAMPFEPWSPWPRCSKARSVRYALIGGLAVTIRGRPRFTQDVDFLLEVPQIMLAGLLDDLIKRGFAIDPAVVIKQFVADHLTSFTIGRVRVDWLKPVLPLYAAHLPTLHPWNGRAVTQSAWPPPRGWS